eukprot:12156681-Ditylum_brightwellii.AAC.1
MMIEKGYFTAQQEEIYQQQFPSGCYYHHEPINLLAQRTATPLRSSKSKQNKQGNIKYNSKIIITMQAQKMPWTGPGLW